MLDDIVRKTDDGCLNERAEVAQTDPVELWARSCRDQAPVAIDFEIENI
jgi:hypothetical protein